MHALKLLTGQHCDIGELLERIRTEPDQRDSRIGEVAEAIAAHLAIEHELFYPRVAQLSPAVRSELALEAAEIKRVLADLIWLETDDPCFASTLANLAALFEGHAAWQDQELFVSVSDTVPPAALVDLGASMVAGFEAMRGVGRTRAA